MICLPSMLVEPAIQGGIKVPEDLDDDMDIDGEEFPHFVVYLNVQLGSPMPSATSHWNNAKIVGAIPEDKIKTITWEEITELGIEVGYSN